MDPFFSNAVFSLNDDSNFPWDFTSIEDNVEAQKLLAAAIAHNDQYRFDEDQKRKLEMLEDAAQQTPSKANKLNINSVPHPDLDAEAESIPSTPDNTQFEQSNEPQKKKPGRKPLTNTPSNVSQNRAAQRAFRERKERYVKELETKIEELESLSAKSAQENQQLKTLVEQLQAENYLLKQTSFTFDFPLSKSTDSTVAIDKDINDLVIPSGTKSISSSSVPASNASDPYTPPSSSTSDDEPGSPNSVSDQNINTTVSSSDNSSQVPSSNTDKLNLPVKKSGSVSTSSHSTKPQNAEEFCEKFTDGMCQESNEYNSVFDITGSSNGATDLNRSSSAFTEYRDPTPFTPNIDNPFSESAPLPPLFEDNFQDFGSFAPMATPTDENKNPIHAHFPNKHEFASLEDIRSKKFLSCNKVWERIQQHPKFDDLEGDEIDQLCAELKSKAKCSGKGPVVPEEDVEA
ncbi:32185_t:CDS:2, partial [Racocetra persica]